MEEISPRISLAQWSLHRAIESGELVGTQFPRIAVETYGIHTVELVNNLLESQNAATWTAMRSQADDLGARILLLMIDDEGDLSSTDELERRKAVENHRRWIDAAYALGCRAIRVNTGAEETVSHDAPASAPEVRRAIELCAKSCSQLCEWSAGAGVEMLIENHGGLSSNIPAVLELMNAVHSTNSSTVNSGAVNSGAVNSGTVNFGTLPDFGNFAAGIDKYEAVSQLMARAGAVSAKCFDFDSDGNETVLDYPRLLKIVHASHPPRNPSGYHGHLGIEYEGENMSEHDGIVACRDLLTRLLSDTTITGDPE